MALDYWIEAHEGVLTVTTSGFDESVDEAVAYGEKIIEACNEFKCSRILVDESRMTGVLDKIGQYELVRRLAMNAPHDLKVAMVVNQDNYQDTSFGTLVAENRGYHIKAFTELADAQEWLAKQS